MKKNIIKNLLLSSVFALATISCSEEEPNNSIVTVFSPTPIVLDVTTPALLVGEADPVLPEDSTYTFTFFMDGESQLTDITVEIGAGSSSTATEGVDFTLETQEVNILALGGQDGFSVDITVHEDGIVNEEDETIFLTFSTTDPSGIQASETKVLTIQDSGIPGNLEMSLSWDDTFEFDGDTYHLADFTDLDFYLYDVSDGSEITGFQGATGSEPEELTLSGGIADGTYEIWVNFWDRYPFESELCEDGLGNEYPCLGPFEVPLVISFTRNGAETTIEYPALTLTNTTVWYRVNGVDTNPYNEYLVGYVEVANGVFTIYDIDGVNVGSMRMKSRTTEPRAKADRVWPPIR